MRKICSGSDCYETVDTDDFVLRPDGTFHPISTKCWGCRKEGDGKKLRRYSQRRRKIEKAKQQHKNL